MKHIFLIASFCTFLVACNDTDSETAGIETTESSNAAVTPNNTANPTENAGESTTIQWIDSTYLDLGKVKQGQVVEVSWKLKNSGNKPLVIHNVAPGCGCTVAEKPEKPIMPGEEAVIKGKFDSNGQSEGDHTKSLTVTANTAGNNTHYLTFKVFVTK